MPLDGDIECLVGVAREVRDQLATDAERRVQRTVHVVPCQREVGAAGIGRDAADAGQYDLAVGLDGDSVGFVVIAGEVCDDLATHAE